MSPTDALSLQACLAALAKLDTPLPPDLHQAIRECKIALEQQQPDAVLRLRNVIVQHPHLNHLYETEMVALQRSYQTQERAKNILALGVPDSTAQTLETIAAQILDTTNDFKQSTQRFLNHYQRQIKDKNPTLQPFIDHLAHAANTLEPRAVVALEELEHKPLSVKDLSYRLNQSVDESQALAQRLWQEGYIVTAHSSLLSKVFPAFRTSTPDFSNGTETYFTLTAKGFFRLHPIIGRSS